jgi:hypothetical protein
MRCCAGWSTIKIWVRSVPVRSGATESDMDTAKQPPVAQFHPKAADATVEMLWGAIGTIPYCGPVVPPDLGDAPVASEASERASD